jgi:hypothetical protein
MYIYIQISPCGCINSEEYAFIHTVKKHYKNYLKTTATYMVYLVTEGLQFIKKKNQII